MKSVYRKWFQTKPLNQIEKDSDGSTDHKLDRTLGPFQLTLLGIGAIIGAGIFATIGTAAAGDANRPGAGPALVFSFFITAIVCGFTALCYAEFASLTPLSGSAYTYSYATLGEFAAWIIGWDLVIEYAVGNIAVAISWANYFKTLLRGLHLPFIAPHGIIIPDWLSMDYRTAAKIIDENGVQTVFRDAPHLFGQPVVFNSLAICIVAIITIILIRGVKESSRFNTIMVAIKIIVLTVFVVVGAFYVNPENYTDFAPNGFTGISAAAATIFFAYIGYDAVTTVAEETENPQRNLPIGIIASLIISTIFYIIVSIVFTGLISYHDLTLKLATQQAEPLTMALDHAMPKGSSNLANGIIALGSVIAHTAVLLVFQMGQPRIFFSMARDGLLPQAFYKVHSKFKTPYIGTLLTGLFVAVFAALFSIEEMVDLTNIGTLFAFIMVCAGIIVLRIKKPDLDRPFKVPGGVIIPILGIISCCYLIYFLPPTSWLRFACWLNFGFVIYVGYGSVKSKLTGRYLSIDTAQHDAKTAYMGAWLGVIGTAFLLVTRWIDLYLLAVKDIEIETVSFFTVLSSNAWFEKSYFLIAPLAINAFVLCPIVIKRTLTAKNRMRDDAHTTRSLIMASFLMIVTGVYLLIVFSR